MLVMMTSAFFLLYSFLYGFSGIEYSSCGCSLSSGTRRATSAVLFGGGLLLAVILRQTVWVLVEIVAIPLLAAPGFVSVLPVSDGATIVMLLHMGHLRDATSCGLVVVVFIVVLIVVVVIFFVVADVRSAAAVTWC